MNDYPIGSPWYLAASGTEHGIQAAVMSWCNKAYRFGAVAAYDLSSYGKNGSDWAEKQYGRKKALPDLKLLFAIPNGGLRGKATAGKLKAEGVKSGVPDLCLPVPVGNWHGLFIEMKKPGGVTSDAQIEWITELGMKGYRVGICMEWEKATRLLEEYLTKIS